MNWCYKEYWKTEEKPVEKPVEKPKEEKPKETKPVNKNIDVVYSAYVNGRWLEEVKNCNDVDINGYAGIENYGITGFGIKSTEGTIKYRVHVGKGKWFSWVNKYNRNDWNNGVAGYPGNWIDGIQMELVGVPGY